MFTLLLLIMPFYANAVDRAGPRVRMEHIATSLRTISKRFPVNLQSAVFKYLDAEIDVPMSQDVNNFREIASILMTPAKPVSAQPDMDNFIASIRYGDKEVMQTQLHRLKDVMTLLYVQYPELKDLQPEIVQAGKEIYEYRVGRFSLIRTPEEMQAILAGEIGYEALTSLKTRGYIIAPDVVASKDISSVTAWRRLTALCDAGILECHGKMKFARYTLLGHPLPKILPKNGDRLIMVLRRFGYGATSGDIADALGISRVHAWRLLTAMIELGDIRKNAAHRYELVP